MLHHSFVALVLTLAACGASTTSHPQTVAKTASRAGLQIRLATIYVDDQEKALRFYTDVMGFTKKDDVENGGFRWLTVEDRGGGQLLLSANSNPAGKAYQQALFEQHQPAVMLFTDDVKADYERLKGKATFTMPPTPVTGSIIAQLTDGNGNLVQLTQLVR